MRMLRTGLVPGNSSLDEVRVVVTVPAFHAPVHYEVDRALGVLRVTGMLRSEPRLVHSCGFIPRTLVRDGRPLEVAVFAPWPLELLSLLTARPVGVLSVCLEGGVMKSRIIAVPTDDICNTTLSIRSADDLGSATLSRFVKFLAGCSDNPQDRELCSEWANACRAKDVIRGAVRAFIEHEQCRRS